MILTVTFIKVYNNISKLLIILLIEGFGGTDTTIIMLIEGFGATDTTIMSYKQKNVNLLKGMIYLSIHQDLKQGISKKWWIFYPIC